MKEALERGTDVLPLVLVDDRIAVEGAYPSRETLAALAGRRREEAHAPAATASCCGPAPDAKSKTGCC